MSENITQLQLEPIARKLASNNAASNTIANTQQAESSVDFSSYLNSSKNLNQIFEEASQTYGVSSDLLKAMAKQESGFNPTATSRAGAQGIMQLMPATAASLGVTNSYDPYQNIMGGAKYISQMLQKYNGNTSLALAAYNAGSNNVDKYGGIPPFAETQNYVASITGFLQNGVTVPDATYEVGNSVNGDASVTYNDLNDFAGELLQLIEEMKSSAVKQILTAKVIDIDAENKIFTDETQMEEEMRTGDSVIISDEAVTERDSELLADTNTDTETISDTSDSSTSDADTVMNDAMIAYQALSSERKGMVSA